MANLVKITFAGDDKSLSSALGRVTGAADKTGSTLRGRLTTGAKIASGALLGGLALAAKAGFSEFVEGQRISAQTGAVLKSTGGAAKVTAGQIEGLAGSIGRMSGIDAEAIQEGQNLLLTFTQIRNEAGAGNKIFDRTTRAMVDMSVAMGTDAKGAAIQVGKALNDPIKGTAALSKAGIQFTVGQKAAIAAMVASGNTMGAQKLILKELETQFGGSAKAAGETFAGQLSKAKNAGEDLAAQIIAGAMPALTGLAGVLGGAATFMAAHETTTKVLIGTLAGLAVAVIGVNTAMKTASAVADAARIAASLFVTTTTAQTVATGGATVAQTGLNTAMKANVIGIVVTAVAALVAGIIIAYKESETFRRIVDGAFDAVKNAAAGALKVIQGIVGAIKSVLVWLGILDRGTAGTKTRVVANLRDISAAARETSRAAGVAAPAGHVGGRALVQTSHTGGIVPGRFGQEVPMTLLAGQRVLPPGERSARGGGGVLNVTINALDPRAAAQAVVEAIRVYERTGGQRFVRV